MANIPNTVTIGSPPNPTPRIIVFSGPPCSGKTTLAKNCARAFNAEHVEMDDVRARMLPESEHSKEDRDIAYRAMHKEAADAIRRKQSVVLDATYAPESHRRAVAAMAMHLRVDLFVIECRVHPDEAVKRFRQRASCASSHPGVDLTEERVRMLAMAFPFTGCGLLLSTDGRPSADLMIQVTNYLTECFPLAVPEEWAGELAVFGPAPSLSVGSDATTDLKLTPWSVLTAYAVKARYYGVVLLVSAIAIVSLLALVVARTTDDYVRATAIVSLGILAAGLFAIVEFLSRETLRNAREITRSARDVSYAKPELVRRSDKDLHEAYKARTKPAEPSRFPIDGRPLFFPVLPRTGVRFSVTVSSLGANWDDAKVTRRSHQRGFDWRTYSQWRKHTTSEEYYSLTRLWQRVIRRRERVMRVCSIDSSRLPAESASATPAELMIVVGRTTYRDYLVGEQGIDLQIPGQIPYLREFLEGENWANDNLKLCDIGRAATMFPMMASVSAIVTTGDNYVVLQRKSQRVQSAGGGVACSATGAVRWRDVVGPLHRTQSQRHKSDPLLAALLREIKSEIGLRRHDFIATDLNQPFTAVAFGLRYGRDINFYAHLSTELYSEEVVKRFLGRRLGGIPTRARRDRWEVAHLIFIRPEHILANGMPDKWLDGVLGDSRHVRGALYSYHVASRLKNVSARSSSASTEACAGTGETP